MLIKVVLLHLVHRFSNFLGRCVFIWLWCLHARCIPLEVRIVWRCGRNRSFYGVVCACERHFWNSYMSYLAREQGLLYKGTHTQGQGLCFAIPLSRPKRHPRITTLRNADRNEILQELYIEILNILLELPMIVSLSLFEVGEWTHTINRPSRVKGSGSIRLEALGMTPRFTYHTLT
jgi:hypothetical protein